VLERARTKNKMASSSMSPGKCVRIPMTVVMDMRGARKNRYVKSQMRITGGARLVGFEYSWAPTLDKCRISD
jgi:hypothetical protein